MAYLSPSYSYKNHIKLNTTPTIPHMVISQQPQPQPHQNDQKPTDPVGRRYFTLSSSPNKTLFFFCNATVRLSFHLMMNRSELWKIWRLIILRSSELAVVGAIFNFRYIYIYILCFSALLNSLSLSIFDLEPKLIRVLIWWGAVVKSQSILGCRKTNRLWLFVRLLRTAYQPLRMSLTLPTMPLPGMLA